MILRHPPTFTLLGSVLGFPRSTQEFVYFNRLGSTSRTNMLSTYFGLQDGCQLFAMSPVKGSSHNDQQVQSAIHAPHVVWEACQGPVYINATTGAPGNDQSIPSTLSVLPNVIEKSERTVIIHGLAVRTRSHNKIDTVSTDIDRSGFHPCVRGHSHCHTVCSVPLSSQGLVRKLHVSRRNMTWGGAQGFQTPIEAESFVVQDFGVYGNMHQERKLTCQFRISGTSNSIDSLHTVSSRCRVLL